jgi:O-acetyl-ADP-ribose deacetylase (regulator of RNase III)
MRIGATEIILKKGDITQERVDAIVNAANSSLLGGGGVDGAIHRAGGPAILNECRVIRARQGGCPTGQAVITTGGRLPARWVVHTVGPVWHDGSSEPDLLRRAYRASLELGAAHGARTIAFPSISTGAYRYPIELAAPIALNAVCDFARSNPAFQEIRVVLFSDDALDVYRRAAAAISE